MSSVVATILARTLTRQRMRASIALAGDDGVERPQPGAAPTAFRVWKAGENPTSKGQTVFSKRSAELLLADQTVRGNLYSIDVDHMSLSDNAPPENHRAVGWHRLAVRDTENGPELWAVDVEWTPDVRAALEMSPPGFRYFSPAYDVERKTGEVVGYLNTALTNNPATYQVTALATRAGDTEEHPMKMEDILAALKAAADGDDEATAKKCKAAYAALTAADEPKEKEPDGDEPKKDSEPDGDEKKEPPVPEKKDTKAAEDEPKEEKDSKAASLDAKVEKLVDARLQVIADNAERERLIASRSDVPAKVLAALKTKPLSLVKEMLEAIPVTARKNPAADVTVIGTRGANTATERASRLSPEDRAAMDERMGITPRKANIRREGNSQTFEVMTPEDAKRFLAAKNGGK